MGLKNIKPEDIKAILGIQEDFQNIDEFCDYLEPCVFGAENTNIRVSIRKLIRKIAPEEKPMQKTFVENVEWIRSNCFIGEQSTGQETKEKDDEGEKVQNCVPETDFEEIMYDFETNIYKDTSPLEEELDYSEGISLREGGIITQH